MLLIGLTLAVLLGGYFRAQRLDHSLWSDEEYTVRTHIWGTMAESEDGTLSRDPVPWRDTFFRNKVNNHLGYTIPTRLLHDTWQGVAATPQRPFSEPILRIIPLLAGLTSIALIGLLVARYSTPSAGVAAALFLALNPWHLRYSVEARGYSQGVLFLLLAFLFLIPALRSGRWRYWLLFAAAEFLTLISLLGAVYVLILANAIAIGCIFLHGRKDRPLRTRAAIAGRMLVANLLAAMLFIQLVLPSVPQISEYMKSGPLAGEIHLSWWRAVWSLFSSGLPIHNPLPGQHLGSSFTAESARLIGFAPFLNLLLPALALIGFGAALYHRSWLTLPIIATVGGGILAFIQSRLTGNTMHPWYILYILPGLVILIVLGTRSCVAWIPSGKNRELPTAIAFAVFLTAYGIYTAPARYLLCHQERQPIREAAKLVRGENAYTGNGENLITASFGTSKGMITSYDPRVHILKKPSDLKKLIEQANRENKNLTVYQCGLQRAQQEDQKFLTLVQDGTLFEEQQPPIRALEELFTYHIYRYIGATASQPAVGE